MRAAIYLRLSHPDDANKLRGWEKDCERRCAELGWSVVRTYTDDGVSGWQRSVQRPAFEAMLADFRNRQFDSIVTWKLDRFSRRGIGQVGATLDELEERGGRLISIADGIDTATTGGRMQVAILAEVARAESENTSFRLKDRFRRDADAGQPKRAQRPFGLTADWSELVPAEAEVLRDAASRILGGASLRSIVLDLNRRGVATATGGRWSAAGLRNALLRPSAIGKRSHKGVIVADGSWPAVLDPDTQTQLRAVLSDPSRRTRRGNRSRLLTGMVICGRCGTKMRVGSTRNGTRRYQCPPAPDGCNGMAILAEPLEELVTDALFEVVDSPRLARAVKARQRRRAPDPTAELAAAEAVLTDFSARYAAGEITRAEWDTGREIAERRITTARTRVADAAQLEAPNPYVGKGGVLRERWPDLSVGDRRVVAGGILEAVTIAPANGSNRFDPDRVTTTWRL